MWNLWLRSYFSSFFVIQKFIISIVWFDSFQTTKFITTDKTQWTNLHSFCLNNKNAHCSLSLFGVAFELWEFNDFTRHFHIFRVFNRMKNLLKSRDMTGIWIFQSNCISFWLHCEMFQNFYFCESLNKAKIYQLFLFYRKLNVYINFDNMIFTNTFVVMRCIIFVIEAKCL